MRPHPLRFLLGLVLVALTATLLPAQSNWRWLNTLPASTSWKGLAYGNGIYVVVGDDATIASSTDAINWTVRRMGTAGRALASVAFADGKFVAVGMGTATTPGAALLMTSTDGITWTTNEGIASSYNAQLKDVVYGNGIWVVVGASQSRVLTSTDAQTWTPRNTGFNTTRGTFGGGKFVLMMGGNRAVVSTDGVTWTPSFIVGDATTTTHVFESVAYGNGKFVAAGRDNNFNGVAYTSTDAVTWTSSASIASKPLVYLAFHNGLFVTGGNPGTNSVLLTSPDGAAWTQRASGMPQTRSSAPNSLGAEGITGVAGANNTYFALGSYGTISTSTDGATWTRRSKGTAHDINGLIWDGTRFVGTGTGGTVVTSPDGTTWTAATTNQTGWFGQIAYANGRYVTAGIAGLFHSTNLTTWTAVTTNQMYGVIYANNLFVAAYFGGLGLGLRTSTDGATWDTITVVGRNGGGLAGLAGGGGTFVVTTGGFGATPKIFSSPNGSTWTDSTPAGLTEAPASLAYGNGRYVMLTSTEVWTSTNSTTWTKSSLATNLQLSELFFVAGKFVVRTGTNGSMSSTDGVTWNTIPGSERPNGQFTALIDHDGTLYASTYAGGILAGDIGAGTSTASGGRIINMSIRTTAGTGDNTLIVGITLGGANTAGSKAILVRGVGPTLGAFNVPGFIPDPVLSAYQGNTLIASNDDWAGGFDFNSVGAFGFSGNPPKDAAIYNPAVPAGSYSVQITGKNNATGIALAEIYDTTPAASFTSSTPRLINVSARATVGTGGGILITGFVVDGTAPVRVLVRAVGPTLAGYGVSNVLLNPKLEVYNAANAKIGENDDWAGAADLKTAFNSVFAFGYAGDASKDAAVVVTLPPGSYTAQLSGVGGTTGVALIEVYELP